MYFLLLSDIRPSKFFHESKLAEFVKEYLPTTYTNDEPVRFVNIIVHEIGTM